MPDENFFEKTGVENRDGVEEINFLNLKGGVQYVVADNVDLGWIKTNKGDIKLILHQHDYLLVVRDSFSLDNKYVNIRIITPGQKGKLGPAVGRTDRLSLDKASILGKKIKVFKQ